MNTLTIIIGIAAIAILCVIVLKIISKRAKVNDVIKLIKGIKSRIVLFDHELNSPLDYVYTHRLTPEARKNVHELEDRYQAMLLIYKEEKKRILDSLDTVYPEGRPFARATLARLIPYNLILVPEDALRDLKRHYETLLGIGNDAKRIEREDLEEQHAKNKNQTI
jgi:hypothetical protein